jgi:hypothetical protein
MVSEMTMKLGPIVLVSLSLVLAGSACEVRHSGDDGGTDSGDDGSGDDGGSSGGSGDDGSGDGGSSGGSSSSGGGTGEECPEGEIYVHPGCGDVGDIMPE